MGERDRVGSLTVVQVGTFGGTPELPCPGTVVPGWHRTWRPPVRG